MNTDVDRVVAHLSPGAGPGMTEGAQALMRDIMAAEPAPSRAVTPLRAVASAGRRGRRSRVLRAAVPGVALLAAAFLGLSWLLPAGHGLGPGTAAALDIKKEDGYYVIEVKDLYADSATYEAQLRDAGLDVTLNVVPSTPALVGSVSPTSITEDRYLDEIKTIDRPGECDKMGGCPIGVKIPENFEGHAEITIGREARPGERFQNGTAIDALGEPLHCLPYIGRTVAEVRGMLQERGVTVQEFDDMDPVSGGTKESVPDSWLVEGGSMTEPGKASLNVYEGSAPQEPGGRRGENCPTS
ncbi:hypothetical protein GCM10010149_34260 [Nonomuraea roseoviolacea subsp. roseoviolacea]|uniref:PASTA domain-containing protein n=1 Tax=Nonomuraea roseoviolacea subsp. carminata TaxID=160689 RepID=A0ABT1K351_9ACTN|nr:hypothetical protein [Nonomuraea roseoviolacea]MCP2348052.1 hypothetical protein [Nonomuraea roseoviolacea subsp. carminata]